MRYTIHIVKATAIAQGLSPVTSNPGGSLQTSMIVDFGSESSEVDWRNLCPESIAETGDRLTMLDFINSPYAQAAKIV